MEATKQPTVYLRMVHLYVICLRRVREKLMLDKHRTISGQMSIEQTRLSGMADALRGSIARLCNPLIWLDLMADGGIKQIEVSSRGTKQIEALSSTGQQAD